MVRRVAVTGAAGKTGRAVIAAAVARGIEVRALVHRDGQADAVRSAGATDVHVGDQRDVATVTTLLRGTDAVYAIAPNLHPDEVVMGRALVAGARRAGVGRVVYHSVVNPQLTAMPHHADKARVEEVLLASRLPATILRPNAYHDNVLGHLDAIRSSGYWEVPYDPFARIASIALSDVADVAATVLAEPGHEHAAHDLSGPELFTPADGARVLSEVLGRVVLARRGDPEAMAGGVAAASRDRLRAMFACYDAMGSPGNPATATVLLGRPPTTFRDWARQVLG